MAQGAPTWKGLNRMEFDGGNVMLPGDILVLYFNGSGLPAGTVGSDLLDRIDAGAVRVNLAARQSNRLAHDTDL